MKKQLMNLLQLPLFQRFCVRMLFGIILFTSLSIKSKTPFYHSDSVIFISEGSYLFNDSQDGIYTKAHLSEKQNASEKQEYKSIRKAFFKSNLPNAEKNADHKIEPVCFTLPQTSHYIGNAGNSLSTAVLGNFSPLKKHHKITGPIFRTFLKNFTLKQKLQGVNKESLNILKITASHFSRPPPMI